MDPTTQILTGIFFIFFLILYVAGLMLFAASMIYLAILIEIIRTEKSTGWKILWALIVCFLALLGIILYFLIGRKDVLENKRVKMLRWTITSIALYLGLTIAIYLLLIIFGLITAFI